MMLFAQAAETAGGIAEAFDRFGVSTMMLAAFILGTAYIGRRCFAEKNGIFVVYVRSAVETMSKISATAQQQADTLTELGHTCKQNADTQAKLAGLVEASDQRLTSIEQAMGKV